MLPLTVETAYSVRSTWYTMSWSLVASWGAARRDTSTLPSFGPPVAGNHEIRSLGPRWVRTASTWDESAIAAGIPWTAALPSGAPVTLSTTKTEPSVLALGRLA